MKSFKNHISEVAQPEPAEEKKFKDQHKVDVKPHPVAPETQHKGVVKPKAKRKADQEGDANYDMAYESAEQLDELSPNTLHRYIKGASKDLAKRSRMSGYDDSRGNYADGDKNRKRANKRIDGIASASGRISDKANQNESVETLEENEAIGMMMNQLGFIKYAAEEMSEWLSLNTEVEAWFQSKLAMATQQLQTLHGYMEGERNGEEDPFEDMYGESLEEGWGKKVKKEELEEYIRKNKFSKMTSTSKSNTKGVERFAIINDNDDIEVYNSKTKRLIRKVRMSNHQSAIQRLKKANYKSSLDTFKGYQMWYKSTEGGVRFSDVDRELEEGYGKKVKKEELSGGQKKLDHNKNGKIDAHDFHMMRKKKKNEEAELDEVSQSTLWSYHAKAGADLQKKREKLNKGTLTMKDLKKGQNRVKGLNRAADKMHEEEQIDEVTRSAVKRPVNITDKDGKTRTVYKNAKTVSRDEHGQEKIKTNESVLDEAFKAGIVKFADKSSMVVKKEDADILNSLFKSLSGGNRKKMEEVAMRDKKGFDEILGFAKEAL